jgi:hypothetical protein
VRSTFVIDTHRAAQMLTGTPRTARNRLGLARVAAGALGVLLAMGANARTAVAQTGADSAATRGRPGSGFCDCPSEPAPGSRASALPFSVGERLTYRVRIGKVGSGHGVMSVDGPVEVRGRETYLLRSEVEARIGFVKASNATESWLDPERLTALRFRRRERRALLRNDETIAVFPDERRWEDEGKNGKGGETPTDVPLDELSFIYFLRTLPLGPDSAQEVVRHYDPRRNPIEVRVVGRDSLETPAGSFNTLVVEMHVRDPGRYEKDGGRGTIRLYLSDDARRIPVRIESAMPVFGRAVLTLESYTPAPVAQRAP